MVLFAVNAKPLLTNFAKSLEHISLKQKVWMKKNQTAVARKTINVRQVQFLVLQLLAAKIIICPKPLPVKKGLRPLPSNSLVPRTMVYVEAAMNNNGIGFCYFDKSFFAVLSGATNIDPINL